MIGTKQFEELTVVNRCQSSILSLGLMFAITLFASTLTQAQTYSVLYRFQGGTDGSGPRAGLIRDGAGNLYGTTFAGDLN